MDRMADGVTLCASKAAFQRIPDSDADSDESYMSGCRFQQSSGPPYSTR